MALNGSCLCGGVAYEIAGEPLEMSNCHCSMCRRAHGGAYTTFLKVRRKDFRITSGAERVAGYASSPGVTRSFCSECGGKFTFEWDAAPDVLWLAAGTLDDDPGMTPSRHIFVGSKADWFEIHDDLQQFDAYPPTES